MSWMTRLLGHLPKWMLRTLALLADLVAVVFYTFAIVLAVVAVIAAPTVVVGALIALGAALCQSIAMLSQYTAASLDAVVTIPALPTSVVYALPITLAAVSWAPAAFDNHAGAVSSDFDILCQRAERAIANRAVGGGDLWFEWTQDGQVRRLEADQCVWSSDVSVRPTQTVTSGRAVVAVAGGLILLALLAAASEQSKSVKSN